MCFILKGYLQSEFKSRKIFFSVCSILSHNNLLKGEMTFLQKMLFMSTLLSSLCYSFLTTLKTKFPSFVLISIR
jgi:hypothetical protein